MPIRARGFDESYLEFLFHITTRLTRPAPTLSEVPQRLNFTARPARQNRFNRSLRPRRNANLTDNDNLSTLLEGSYTDSSSDSDSSQQLPPNELASLRRRLCPVCRGAHNEDFHAGQRAHVAPIGTGRPPPHPTGLDQFALPHHGFWFPRWEFHRAHPADIEIDYDDESENFFEDAAPAFNDDDGGAQPDYAALDDPRNPLDDIDPSERILFQPGLRVDAPPPYQPPGPPPPAYDESPLYSEHDLLGTRGGRAEWWAGAARLEMEDASRAEESAFGGGWNVVPRRLRARR